MVGGGRPCDFDERCSSVSHPNIVMFYGASSKKPNLALIMELCVSGSVISPPAEVCEDTGQRGSPCRNWATWRACL